MYVCLCNGITDRTLREAVRAGARSLPELTAATGCGACCGSCLPLAQEIVEEVHAPLPVIRAKHEVEPAYA